MTEEISIQPRLNKLGQSYLVASKLDNLNHVINHKLHVALCNYNKLCHIYTLTQKLKVE